uniref:Prostaglandin E receptor 4 n=1 Tax=Strix occidentalis caurina TaxID=311401 RepID=A0A8D0EG84_STROC
ALLAHQLLLLVPRVVPLLQSAELGQRRGRGLVEQQGHGLRLLGLGDQHGVAAQHHRLVLQLVAVDPGEDARQPRVGHAVGDPVQQVEVAGPAQPLVLGVGHADHLPVCLTFKKYPLGGGQRRQRHPLRLLSHSWYQGMPERIYAFQRPVVGVDL